MKVKNEKKSCKLKMIATICDDYGETNYYFYYYYNNSFHFLYLLGRHILEEFINANMLNIGWNKLRVKIVNERTKMDIKANELKLSLRI